MKLFGMPLFQTVIGMFVLTLVLGCNREPDTHSVSGDVKTRIPFTSEGGAYSLQEVGLSGITSLYEFEGQYAKFYIYPSVANNKLTGHQPKTRFMKAGDVYVPEDVMSQQLAVIYAHFQRLAALDQELGAGDVNTWPRDVGISVRYRTPDGLQTDNAFYEGSTDSMMVVPYTRDELPIAINAGILAHEYFHSLYFKLVEKPVFKTQFVTHGQNLRRELFGKKTENVKPEPADGEGKKDTTDFHESLSRAMNEGLADFWAWIYTGDPDFLQVSLPSEKSARTLNLSEEELSTLAFPSAKIWNVEQENRKFASPSCRNGRVYYCLGTKYARTLKALSGIVQNSRNMDSQAARKVVGAAIIKTLPQIKEAFLNLKEGELLEPAMFLVLLKDNIKDIQPNEKQFLKDIVEKTLVPAAAKASEGSVRVGGAEVQPPVKSPDFGALK